MNQLIKELQEVIDKKADNHELKQELSTLVKMLKIGFEKKTNGMEKIPKLFSSNDTKKITKFYDNLANNINGLKVAGSFDQFNEYLKITYGITINFSSEDAPKNSYIKTPKKQKKFYDLYSSYFLDDVPKNPSDAIKRIFNSLDKLNKEYSNESDGVKESLKAIIEKQNEHSPTTVKIIDKLLTNSRLKSVPLEDIANDAENSLMQQQQGIDIILKQSESGE
ncbi:hypothetical protein SBF1_8980002 [Candidatus Desulfosporosinus infrequens]|uniref:Uncharacterized protein n=1 Tax=Candidatus Desulfosporosinus infrequens TaxID=2043169 RepID=A0A2U3LWM0_9FIRM|nr:hypothetical protein SBF1_8980002 [Candidatus Desulfosporosinus infrequens]